MSNENRNEDFVVLAENLWSYMRPKVLEILSSKVGFYRAVVTGRRTGNKLIIQKPFDDTEITLPCVGSASGFSSGEQVVVLTFGDESSAIVIGDGMLTNL